MKKRKVLEKNFLDTMSLEELKERVNQAWPGAFYTLMIRDGAPITLSDGDQLYVTETFSVVVKINYNNIKEVVFKREVENASKPEEVYKARLIYEGLKHKDYVAKSAIQELEHKERLVIAGTPIPEPKKEEEEEEEEEVDWEELPDCSSIIRRKNGTLQLRSYNTHRYNIRSTKGILVHKEDGSILKNSFVCSEAGCTIRFFLKKSDGTIYEIFPSDEKDEKATDKARATARAIAKKKGSGKKTLCIWPSVNNVIAFNKGGK